MLENRLETSDAGAEHDYERCKVCKPPEIHETQKE
jgi:hypothetical protein